MGPVFRAHDPQRERLVAVKLFKLDLPPERVHQLVASLERLIAADLTHPVLAAPLATGIADVCAFLVQDYVAAESLDQTVRETGAMSPAEALRVAAQLGGALDFGAVMNVFHGALHPRDVLLSTDETRLTGLGVARALEQVGVVAPVRRPYTAPERIAVSPWDRRADVFSLAALTHELLWGRRVSGTGRLAAEGLSALPGGDLAALRVVFARALAEDPADRFDTGIEFAEALKQAFPDVAITGLSPTLNPRAPRRKARAQQGALVETRAPRLPLPEPEPVSDAVPASPDVAEAARVDGVTPDPVEPLAVHVAPESERAVELPLAAATVALETPGAEPSPDFLLRSEASADLADTRLDEQDAGPTLARHSEPPPAVGSLRNETISALERSRSAIWPLLLALVVGLARGFAAGYGLGPRGGTPVGTTATSGREGAEGMLDVPNAEPPKETPRVTPEASAPGRLPPPPAIDPAPGRVVVRSTPSGARVVVDGRDRGLAPASVAELALGTHRVQVMRDGYGTEERRVVVTRARPSVTLQVKLTRERGPRTVTPVPAAGGALSVDSRPAGAQVFLDGRLIGVTPLSVGSVPAGEHTVQLEYPGYRRWSSPVHIVGSENSRVTASLEK